MNPQQTLHTLPAIADGRSLGFDPGQDGHDSVVLVRQGRRLHAWLDRCPHHGTPMAWRRHAYLNAAGTRIVCHAHGAEFHIDTGLCTLGPCLGQSLTPVPLQAGDDGHWRLAWPPALPQDDAQTHGQTPAYDLKPNAPENPSPETRE